MIRKRNYDINPAKFSHNYTKNILNDFAAGNFRKGNLDLDFGLIRVLRILQIVGAEHPSLQRMIFRRTRTKLDRFLNCIRCYIIAFLFDIIMNKTTGTKQTTILNNAYLRHYENNSMF